MSQKEVQRVIGEAATDNEFRSALFKDPDKALSGFDLTEDEIAALKAMPAESVEDLANNLDERISMMLVGGEVGFGLFTQEPGAAASAGAQEMGSAASAGAQEIGTGATAGALEPGSAASAGAEESGAAASAGAQESGAAASAGVQESGAAASAGAEEEGASATAGAEEAGAGASAGAEEEGTGGGGGRQEPWWQSLREALGFGRSQD